jgi:hypothetical protein
MHPRKISFTSVQCVAESSAARAEGQQIFWTSLEQHASGKASVVSSPNQRGKARTPGVMASPVTSTSLTGKDYRRAPTWLPDYTSHHFEIRAARWG